MVMMPLPGAIEPSRHSVYYIGTFHPKKTYDVWCGCVIIPGRMWVDDSTYMSRRVVDKVNVVSTTPTPSFNSFVLLPISSSYEIPYYSGARTARAMIRTFFSPANSPNRQRQRGTNLLSRSVGT